MTMSEIAEDFPLVGVDAPRSSLQASATSSLSVRLMARRFVSRVIGIAPVLGYFPDR